MIVVDMKKPETCADCHIINGEYGICEILDRTVWGAPPKDCPIVAEIPDNHGRIIDEKWVEAYFGKYFPIEFPNEMEKAYKLLKLALEDVPTVLEATE